MPKTKTHWKLLGHVGVDAGMLMIGDPCYFIDKDSDAQKAFPGGWSEFCKKHGYEVEHKPQMNYARGHAGLGVVASTSYGDGTYPVYGLFDARSDRPKAMIVVTDDVTDLPELPED